MKESNYNTKWLTGIDRRRVLQTLSGIGTVGIAGCLASDDDSDDENEHGGDTGESVGTAEIIFLGETYTFDDASCEDRDLDTFPDGLQQIFYRNYNDEFAFWVFAWDPDEPDRPDHIDPNEVEVHIRFPTDPSDQSVDVEAYEGQTTIDEIEFEPGSGTSGTAELEPYAEMGDDVEHNPDGGEVEWDISC